MFGQMAGHQSPFAQQLNIASLPTVALSYSWPGVSPFSLLLRSAFLLTSYSSFNHTYSSLFTFIYLLNHRHSDLLIFYSLRTTISWTLCPGKIIWHVVRPTVSLLISYCCDAFEPSDNSAFNSHRVSTANNETLIQYHWSTTSTNIVYIQ